MKDLTGQRFGRLVARQPTEKRLGTSVVWECICDCGNTVYVGSQNLGSFHTQSCGCLQKDIAAELAKSKNHKCVNLTGQRFGRLIAVRATDQRSNKKVIWECKCDCGNTVYVKSTLLKNGHTASCGCLRIETLARNRQQKGEQDPQKSCSNECHENE